MKSDRTDSSSDLEGARELSRRLSSGGAVARRSAPPEPDYVRFTVPSPLQRRPEGGPRPPASPSAPAASEASKPENATTWDDFLARCLPVAEARAAFVIDGQGLLVASSGPIPAAGLEGIGARLVAALEHGRKVQLAEGHDPAVVVELGPAWLTGFAVTLRDGSTLTVGVVGPAALHAETRARLGGALWRWRASADGPAGGRAGVGGFTPRRA